MRTFDDYYHRKNQAFGNRPTGEVVAFAEKQQNTDGMALDLGCGDGRNALYLAAAGYRVTAVDSSSIGLYNLNQQAENQGLADRIDTICDDAREWLAPPLTFDLAIAITLLDHVPVLDIDRVLSRIATTLKPNATLIVKVHTVADPGSDRNRADGEISELSNFIKHYFDHNELKERLDSLFEVLEYEERTEKDTSHGNPHFHGFAVATAIRKPL